MNKNNENKLVPRLRFPEFENVGEWEVRKLGEVGTFFSGGTPDTQNEDYWNGDILWFTPTEVKEKYLKGSNRKITESGLRNSSAKLLPKGSILITTRATIGDIGITLEECTTNQGFQSLVVNKDNSIEFWYYYIYNNKSELDKRASGSTFKEITKSKIITIPIVVPSLSEQQKIAACLSSIDEVITAESQKLELYQQHKKGLLQNLLPQEGETVPKFRFKEFEDSGDWKSDIAKNVFSIFQGFAFSSNDSVDNGVRWLKIADVGIQQINHQSPSYLPIEFKEKYKDFLVKEGDYVIALTRPILNKKLKISKVDNILNESLLNQRVGKLISNECIDFVYYLLQTSKLISTIEQNIAGSEPPNLSTQQIENIEVCIPSTIEEQQKIAACLSSLDDLINAQRQKIELLKQHKKGLLQGLFPPINN
jgi:type I restriction enzyme S subunit